MYICNYKTCRSRLYNFYAIITKCSLQKREPTKILIFITNIERCPERRYSGKTNQHNHRLRFMVNPRKILILTGFLKRRNRPKAGKISQKSACGRHPDLAFTMFFLTEVEHYETSSACQQADNLHFHNDTCPRLRVDEMVAHAGQIGVMSRYVRPSGHRELDLG